jgi:hypothetical protein
MPSRSFGSTSSRRNRRRERHIDYGSSTAPPTLVLRSISVTAAIGYAVVPFFECHGILADSDWLFKDDTVGPLLIGISSFLGFGRAHYNEPVGTTTISGQVSHSLKMSLGLNARSRSNVSGLDAENFEAAVTLCRGDTEETMAAVWLVGSAGGASLILGRGSKPGADRLIFSVRTITGVTVRSIDGSDGVAAAGVPSI